MICCTCTIKFSKYECYFCRYWNYRTKIWYWNNMISMLTLQQQTRHRSWHTSNKNNTYTDTVTMVPILTHWQWTRHCSYNNVVKLWQMQGCYINTYNVVITIFAKLWQMQCCNNNVAKLWQKPNMNVIFTDIETIIHTFYIETTWYRC